MNQYNFCQDQIDESIETPTIPYTMPNSFANSRIVYRTTLETRPQNLFTRQPTIENIFDLKEIDLNNTTQMSRFQSIKQRKLQIMEKTLQQKVMIECTFKPKTNLKPEIRRNFDGFLKGQRAHLQKIEQKKQKIHEEIESKVQKFTYLPRTTKNMKIRNKQNQSVFDRLYQTKKQEISKQKQDFKPKISEKSQKIKREMPIQQILYQDAKQRQQREKQLLKQKQGNKQSIAEQKQVNEKSDYYTCQKFMKQFLTTLQNLHINVEDEISKKIFFDIMYSLRFLPKIQLANQKLPIKQAQLIQEAYEYFNKKYPTIQNLFQFLLAIIGVNTLKWGENNASQKQVQISETQAKNIHNKFNILYRNRLYSQEIGIIQSSQAQCTFKPFINKQSEKLAIKNRRTKLQSASKVAKAHPDLEKTLPEDRVLTHADFLILNKKVRDLEIQYIRQMQLQQSAKQCTFKPKISRAELKKNSTTPNQLTTFNYQSNKSKSTQKIISQFSSTNSNKNPILILDVCFGEKQQQITLKITDMDRVKQIAKFYSDKYSLNSENEAQLQQMLRKELNEMITTQN